MHIPLLKRIVITFYNIFFPPLAVALLTGATSKDTLLNACLFLLAIIPSHIHGFYISAVYFTRKRRVCNGKLPGKSNKQGIWSEKVLTGGAGWDGTKKLKDGQMEDVIEESDFDSARRRSQCRRKRMSGKSSKSVSTLPNGMGGREKV